MGSKKNKIRLKRKRSFQGNQYIIPCKRNPFESTNSLSDTTGDHSIVNSLNIGNHEQQQNLMKKQIFQLLLVLVTKS